MSTNIFEPLRVVAIGEAFVDPAVDVDHTPFALYRFNRDRALLALHDGAVPIEFIVRRLPAKAAAILDRGDRTDGERYQLAFRYACHRIERGGEVLLQVGEDALIKGEHGLSLASPAWVEEVAGWMLDDDSGMGFGLATVEEMGRVAYSTARLAPRARGPFWLSASAATRR